MRFRSGPLRAAAALAVVFVAVRVVYRVLFHGADGTGAVLLPLPVWRLSAPFSHVEILGPVTVDGLTDAALSAVPIALMILACGAVNAVIDISRLLARGARSGVLQGVARAVSIAWATLPSLADSVRSARFAQRLRGERAGVRLLAPVLEHTLERATAVAAALELRGYAGRGLAGDAMPPAVLRGFAAGFGASPEPVVATDSVALRAASLTVLTGPTGSGKSTLLRALSGLHSHLDGGWITGTAEVWGYDRAATPPRDLSRRVGVVLQHPRQAFAMQRVDDEIALALEMRGAARALSEERTRAVADRVGITPLLGRRLDGLSAGEATLVAIAAAIVDEPGLLLVDEPLADLDVAARAHIVALLAALAHEEGICVVVAEHRADDFAAVADEWLRVGGGRVRSGDRACLMQEFSTDLAHFDGSPEVRRAEVLHSSRGAALTADGITVRHGQRVAVDSASLRLAPGEVVALRGPNGAGKSSLLAALATGDHASSVALVPDDADALFVRDTVAAECHRVDRRRRLAAGTAAARFGTLLGLAPDSPELAALARRHPRDLSAGQRRCLAIALQTAAAPRVLLIDEPTRGLDPHARALIAHAVLSAADGGTAVLFATHDAAFAALADRELAMDAGVLEPAPSAADEAPDGAAHATSETPRLTAAHANHETPRLTVTHANHEAPGRAVAHATSEGQGHAVAHAAGGVPAATPPASVWGDAPAERSAPDGGPPATGIPPVAISTPATRTTKPQPTALTPIPTPATRATTTRNNTPRPHRPAWRTPALIAANLVAAAAFLWPLIATAAPSQAQAAVPYIALSLAPLAIVLVLAALDESVRSAHTLALLAVLTAVGAAIRIASTGVGGVEALFVLLILAGRAYGARFGLLLGAASIALSAFMWGGIGPWMPFQMFACGWVGAGAGVLPRRVRGGAEIAMLAVYGVVASYLFGLVMNLWFWPFAVGSDTSISYVPGGSLGQNVGNFLVYSLLTSTAGWDTLRAVTTVIGLALVGRALLRSLRRAKPVASTAPAPQRARITVEA